MIGVEFRGLDELIRNFQHPNIEDEVGKAQSNWATDLMRYQLRGVDKYPPPPAGSTYVRTGTLGNSWTTRQAGPLNRVVLNPTPYARWVVGDASGGRQARMHQGRWWTMRQKVLDYLPSLQHRIELRLRHLLGDKSAAAAGADLMSRFLTGPVTPTVGPYRRR